MFLSILLIVSILFNSTTAIFAQDSEDASPTKKPAVSPTAKPLVPDVVPEAGVNVTLSPTFMSLVTDPGKEVSSQIRIKNNNNFTEFFRFSLARYEASEGGDRPVLIPITKNDEFVKWISFSEDQFRIAANQTKTIRVTIKPPKTASLGYYYAILLNRISEGQEGISGAVVAGAPAMMTLLEVRTPYAKKELQLVEISTDKLIYEYLPVEFRVKVKNTGNIHIAPYGDIFIDQGSNKDIAIFRVNEARGNVLPQSARTFTSSWSDGFIVRVPKEEDGKVVRDDRSNVVLKSKWDFAKADKFRIGKYTANVIVTYNNGEFDVPLEAKVSFWVIPWKIILVGLGILILVLLGIKSIIGNALRGRRR